MCYVFKHNLCQCGCIDNLILEFITMHFDFHSVRLLFWVIYLIQGAGRAFSAGGDLKMFYDGRKSSKCASLQ